MAPQPRARTLAGGLAAALAALLVAALASGCAGGPAVDTRYTSPNQDSRVLFIVVHYTVGDFANALRTLTTNSDAPVSAHYLVGDAPPTVYRLVDESRRAWHAGASCWQDHCGLNASSVGIEIVNPGFRAGAWVPFPPGQIDAVVALIRDIAWRHAVRGDRILGHNEIQPQGKEDSKGDVHDQRCIDRRGQLKTGTPHRTTQIESTRDMPLKTGRFHGRDRKFETAFRQSGRIETNSVKNLPARSIVKQQIPITEGVALVAHKIQ